MNMEMQMENVQSAYCFERNSVRMKTVLLQLFAIKLIL